MQKDYEQSIMRRMLKHHAQNTKTSCQNILHSKYRDFVLKRHAQNIGVMQNIHTYPQRQIIHHAPSSGYLLDMYNR